MKNPTIYLGNLRVDEPVTMLTDVLVAAVCIYAFFKLRPLADRTRQHRLLLMFFLFMGVATFLGGVLGHGFTYTVGLYAKLPGWLISMLAVNFVERSMILYTSDVVNDKVDRFFSVFNIIELLTFAGLAFGTLNFLWVEVHSTYGFLIVVFGLALLNYIKGKKTKQIKLIMWAVGSIFICSVVFVAKIAPDKWFTHADLAHVFMAIGAFLFYKAARLILIETKNNPDSV